MAQDDVEIFEGVFNAHIVYDTPVHADCPVCGGLGTVYAFIRADRVRARCSKCLRAGDPSNWLGMMRGEKSTDPHEALERLSIKYSAPLTSGRVGREHASILRKLGVHTHDRVVPSRFTWLGVSHVHEVARDVRLVRTDRLKLSNIEYADELKESPCAVLPLHLAWGQTAGLSLFTGKCWIHLFDWSMGQHLGYLVSSSPTPARLFVFTRPFVMTRAIGQRLWDKRAPMDCFCPFKITEAFRITTRFLAEPEVAVVTSRTRWGIMLARHFSESAGVRVTHKELTENTTFSLAESGVFDKPYSHSETLRAYYRKTARHDPDNWTLLRESGYDLFLRPPPAEALASKVFVSGWHLYACNKTHIRAPRRIMDGLILVSATADGGVKGWYRTENSTRPISGLERRHFSSRDSFNRFLRSKGPPVSSLYLFEWFEGRDILKTLLAISPIIRRHLRDEEGK